MSGAGDPEQIKAEIDATREQLSRTVDELGARLDVPARTKESVARAKDTAVETYRESPPAVIGAGAGAVGLVGRIAALRRRRRKRAARPATAVVQEERSRARAKQQKSLAKARAKRAKAQAKRTKEAAKARRAAAKKLQQSRRRKS